MTNQGDRETGFRIIEGDALTRLREMDAGSVQTCVTSPPYWGLRDYGSDDQLGLEPTPELYVANMVEVFREVRRVLRDDGTLWLNLGDSYCSTAPGTIVDAAAMTGKHVNGDAYRRAATPPGLKPKDLVGVPWAVAEALRDPYYTGVIRDSADRRWLAGIIDSEGCIYISRSKVGATTGRGRNYKRSQDAFQIGVAITQRSPELLHECARIFGRGDVRRAGERAWEWRIYSANARDLLREVYPYLIGKQHEARLALGCPPSGEAATAAWEALKAIHQGGERDVDFPAPASMFEPGFYLRSDIIWAKPNPMPESVTDRPTKAHEYLFLLSKSSRYYYDATAIREDFADERMGDPGDYAKTSAFDRGVNNDRQDGGFIGDGGGWTRGVELGGRNRRSVWTVTTQPFPGAHFATFPPKLIEPCILAGAAEGDLVLDPFAGSGTTGLVALRHNRSFVGIELNPTYAQMARDRIYNDAPLLNVEFAA